MPIDRPHHATTINYFLRSLHRIFEESGARFEQSLENAIGYRPLPAHMSVQSVPADCQRCYPVTVPLQKVLQDARTDLPLRAKSVCLTERPRSKYVRNVRSADTRSRYSEKKQFFHQRPPPQTKPRLPMNKVIVKQQNRKIIEKVPCAISVQTLSIPMKYADTNTKHSTSKRASIDRVDYKTKTSNPPKQVSDYKRLCSTVSCGKETENKLLLQICEAEQVSDFERILNSNAILCEKPHGHVWRGCERVTSSTSVLSRPRSSYSLKAVSQVYHHLFHQHEESLQPLIQQYRQAVAADETQPCPPSILQEDWFENLQHLSEFYEDDQELQQEIETITDKIVLETVKASEFNLPSSRGNFNVNLTDLIGLHVNGEGFSPISTQDCPSPDVEKGSEHEAENKEWLKASMSANSEFETVSQNEGDSVDSIADNLESCKISSDAKVPTITFSNCCEGRARSELPDNNEVVIHLTVPSIESVDESRPPM